MRKSDIPQELIKFIKIIDDEDYLLINSGENDFGFLLSKVSNLHSLGPTTRMVQLDDELLKINMENSYRFEYKYPSPLGKKIHKFDLGPVLI